MDSSSSATADYHQIDDFLLAKVKDALAEVLRTTAKHLPAKLSGISSIFKDLMSNFLEAEVPKQTREKLYKLDNLLDEWKNHSKKKKKWYWYHNYLSVDFFTNFKQELTKIQEEFAGVSPTSSNGLQTTSLREEEEEEVEPSLRGEEEEEEEVKDFRWSNRLVDVNKVYGIHDKVMSLQQFLVVSRRESDDHRRFSMIGLVGIRGIGKTTMAQAVFDKPEVKKHFLPRIWVCASKQPEALLDGGFDPRIEIVKRMLMCLGLEEKVIESAQGHGLKGLLCTLRLQLRGKRYLIVLDHVWCKDDKDEEDPGRAFSTFCSSLEKDESKYCEKLAYGLPKGYGGAVIVTSRIKKLAMDMVGEDNLHTVKQLKDPFSCWKIFKDSARQIDEQVEDEEATSVEATTATYDNGHVDKREDHGEVISASDNGHVDQQEQNQIEDDSASASANGYVDQQQEEQNQIEDDSASANGYVDHHQQQEQNQTEEDSASANGQEEKPVEDSTDGRVQVVETFAKQEEDDPLEERFKEMKERIIQKCAGIPLAAVMLGEIARESLTNETGEPESGPREQEEAAENPREPESTRSEEPHDLED